MRILPGFKNPLTSLSRFRAGTGMGGAFAVSLSGEKAWLSAGPGTAPTIYIYRLTLSLPLTLSSCPFFLNDLHHVL